MRFARALSLYVSSSCVRLAFVSPHAARITPHKSRFISIEAGDEADLSIYLFIPTMEEEEEESVQDLLNGVQLIGRCSIRYEKFPRGISRWRKKPELEETASILKEGWIYRERKSFQIVCFDEFR